MSKGFLAGVIIVFFAACATERKVCPAYQSAFIFDQEAVRKRFSTFENDSTPKVYFASKNNRFLILPEETYRKKLKSLQTIEMKPVYTVLPDTSKDKKGKGAGDAYKAPENIDSLLRTQTRDLEAPPEEPKPPVDSAEVKKDSVAVDSSYQISKDKEVRFYRYHWDSLRKRTEKLRGKKGEELTALYRKYQKSNDSAKYRVDNIRYSTDQENYMWYLRDVLVLPDVRAAIDEEKRSKENEGKPSSPAPDTAKKVGFFKGLFKKKPKSDSTDVSEPDLSEAAIDEVAQDTTTKKKKRKVKKAEKKKDDSQPKPAKDKKKDPAKKEEDDGF